MDTSASGDNGEQARLSWVTYGRGAESCGLGRVVLRGMILLWLLRKLSSP